MGKGMSDLQVFNFESREIRTVVIGGEPWWVAKDVAEALGHEVFNSHLLDKVPDEWKGMKQIHTPGGEQNMACLSEQGLYFFLSRSDKPLALPFQKWVAGEVVPSIRKTGGYGLPGVRAVEPVTASVIKELRLAAQRGFITPRQFREALGIREDPAAAVQTAAFPAPAKLAAAGAASRFLKECPITGKHPISDIYADFVQWAKDNGVADYPDITSLARSLIRSGVRRTYKNGRPYYGKEIPGRPLF
jgi:prophage antirepressor-like protein